ncbi:hypothetical protein NQ318_019989 [Aromia moschata]|uniref:Uncharacterized protein n=1 Tax=Aromia moschata TaxID=1265417 RepID=A0AAV8Y6W8_9CUCU|nr:hypothetical protein NQ318_019989 [Aromia moschata]
MHKEKRNRKKEKALEKGTVRRCFHELSPDRKKLKGKQKLKKKPESESSDSSRELSDICDDDELDDVDLMLNVLSLHQSIELEKGVNYLDVAPNYASIMLGFGNTFGSLSGVISPILTGYIVTDEFSADQWKIILYVASGIYFVGMIIYGACASGELQPWAVDSRTPREEDVQEEDPSSVHLT